MKRTITSSLAFFFLLACTLVMLESTSASDTKKGSVSVTFSRDVAPIIFKNCADCHRPGELAPMSLLTYKDARPWARSIKEKVVTRRCRRGTPIRTTAISQTKRDSPSRKSTR